MGAFAFRHIAEALREDIRGGVVGVGGSLPSERELSRRFEVSPGTVRVALKELVAEGTVDGTRGRPKTVVRVPRPSSSFDEFHSFAQWARGHGRAPGGRVVEKRWQIASELDETLLQAAPGRRILAVTRVRTLDGETVMLERTHYPEWLGEIVDALPDDVASVTSRLADEHGVHFSHAEHMFGAEGARARDAAMLGISRGTALLMHRRVSRDPAGRLLEWATDRYISGRIMVSVGNSRNSNPLRWALPGSEPGI